MNTKLKAYLVTSYVRVEVNRLVFATSAYDAVQRNVEGLFEDSWAEDVSTTRGTARRSPESDPDA